MRTIFLLAAVAIAVPSVAADAPTSQPAVTTFFPSARNLTYRLPAGWQAQNGGSPSAARYTAGPDASVSITLLPAGAQMTPEFPQQYLQKMRDARKKDKTSTTITEPTLEPDDRFAMRVREKYTQPDAKKTPHTSEDLLLCRVVGDRLVMMSVKSTSTEPEAVKAVQKAAEDVLLSVGANAGGPFATGPAATAVLGGGMVTYTPPADWQPGKSTPTTVSYVTATRDGIMAINLLPTDAAAASPEARDAIVKQLKGMRTKSGYKVVLEPTVESDDRFALKVHERYELGRNDGSKKIADQLHLYRVVGPRLVMLTVNTVADDPEVVTKTQKAGEDVLLSAELRKPGTPKGK